MKGCIILALNVSNPMRLDFSSSAINVSFTPDQLELIEEERIEISCNESDAKNIVKVIRETSSYEEPAVFVYSLLNIN